VIQVRADWVSEHYLFSLKMPLLRRAVSLPLFWRGCYVA
jgi:hypothetical protein